MDPDLIKKEGERLITLYERHFDWAEMCPTIHKLLAHGWWLIQNMPETLVVGMMSEEALEHNNKSLKFQGSKRKTKRPNHPPISPEFSARFDAIGGDDPKKAKKHRKLPKRNDLNF